MFESVFVVLMVMYALVSIKVDQWITIAALGFKTETPQMFLEKPRIYDVIRSALFVAAACSAFAMTVIPWYVGLGILAFVWLGASWIGRKNAFNDYRRILREMMEHAETASDRAEYETDSKRTDQELQEIAQRSLKWGI